MKPSILYSDMDGTLLPNGGAISAENRAAIRELVEAGGQFSLATGRSELSTRVFAEQLPLTLPAILYNGAAVYDFRSETFLHRVTLPAHLVQWLAHTAIQQVPDVGVQAFAGGPTRHLNPAGQMDAYTLREKQPFSYLPADRCGDCFKMLFYAKHPRLEELERLFADAPQADTIHLVYSADYFLEVLPRRANKGTALAWIASYLHKTPADFAAIGDFDNDVEMIRWAGIGAAPADGQPCAREAADLVVADHRHDAVADLIRRALL